MSISYIGRNPTDAEGTTSSTPDYPAGFAADDVLVLCVVSKYTAPTTPSGWTLQASIQGGSGASGADSGQVYTSVYTKTATGSESGTLAVSVPSGNSTYSRMIALRTTSGAAYFEVATGTETTAGTNWSVTTGTLANVAAGDMIVSVAGTNTWLVNYGSESLAMSGLTFSSHDERSDNATANGDNCALVVSTHPVSAGSASVAGTFTMTATGSAGNYPAGSVVLLRVSESAPSDPPSGVADALIEVDVTNDPRSGVTTWTDITAYARGTINITRGRQDELSDQLSPATATISLDNSDGRFTPDLTTGTYYPGFRKGMQVRISVDLDSTTYRRFRGYVDTIDGPGWPGGVTQQSFVTLTCSDELAQWSKGRKFKDVLTETILRDNPDAYYPLTDGERIDESGNDQPRLDIESRNGGGVAVRKGQNGNVKVTPELLYLIENDGQRRDLDPETSDARNWRGGSFRFKQGAQGGHNYLARALTIATSDRWAIGAWVRCSRDTDGDGGWVVFLKNGSRYLGIGYNGTGEARASVYDATDVANVTGPRLTNNDWHHIFVHYDRAANIELYVDGRSKGTVAAENWDNSTANPTLWIGSGQYNGSGNYSGIARGNVAHVAVFSGDNADDAQTNVADHYEAGWNGFRDARTGEMMDRVVGWMAYPGSTDIANGLSTVGDGFAQGATALEYAQLLIDSEVGSLYTRGDGTLVFHQRDYRFGNTTNILTVSSYHDTQTGFRTDDQYLVNRARYNMPNGGRGIANNATSIADYGPYERTVETLLRNEYAAEGLAKFMIYRLKTPDARLISFPIDVLTAPTWLAVAALTVEIDDRVRMTNLPAQAKASSVTGFVEGYTETIGTPEQAVWQIVFNTSPTYTLDDHLILDHATEGQLDQEKLSY